MAISATHFELLKELRTRAKLRHGARILEIGQANLYGDFDPQSIRDLLPPRDTPSLLRAIADGDSYELAKLIYLGVFGSRSIKSIDAGGPNALRVDLNSPVAMDHPFELSINHGTAEHVFDIGNVFRTMHDNTLAGGVMVHESPFMGWVDHGFYCLQPTLFWDLAAANRYEVIFCAIEHLASRTYAFVESREQILELKRCDRLADNLMLFVALRKTVDVPFIVPTQGVYAGTVSEQAEQSWRALR